MNGVDLINQITSGVNLPNAPDIDTSVISNILHLWNFSDSAYEVTSVFQNLLTRLPPYFLAYFALSFMFIVVGLLVHLVTKVL